MNIAITNVGLGNLICMTPALSAIASIDSEPVSLFFENPRTRTFAEELFINWNAIQIASDDKMRSINAVLNLNNIFQRSRMHEILHHMQVAYGLGYRGKIPELYQTVQPTDWIAIDPYICIANSCAQGWERKLWSQEHFRKLVRLLDGYFPEFNIVKIGTGQDLSEIKCDIDFVGQLNILETANVIKGASYIITNDSAILHIADALNVPSVCIFGPTLVSKNRPWQSIHEIARSNKMCAPCHGNTLWDWCGNADCMQLIQPSHVMSAMRRLVKRCHIDKMLTGM